MDTATETNTKIIKSVQILAVISAIVGIVSLFLNWVDINETYSVYVAILGMEIPIPVEMKATAINVVEGNIGIPDDWHIYMPALAGIIPVIGALVAIFTFFKPQARKAAAPALIILGFASITCACLFYAWEFDVMFDLAQLYADPTISALVPPGILSGEVPVGYMHVKDVIVEGFYAALVAGILLIVNGLADAYLSKE